MKKVLLSIIVICFVSIAFCNSVHSTDTICNEQDNDNPELLSKKYKDYWNCRIRNSQDLVDGVAYLFPG